MQTLANWLSSSQDPEAIANKVKGVLLMGSSVVIYLITRFFHITILPQDYISLATDVGALVGALWSVYGILLHITTKVRNLGRAQ